MPGVLPIAASKSGWRRMSSWPYGEKASWAMMRCKGLIGDGSPWTRDAQEINASPRRARRRPCPPWWTPGSAKQSLAFLRLLIVDPTASAGDRDVPRLRGVSHLHGHRHHPRHVRLEDRVGGAITGQRL